MQKYLLETSRLRACYRAPVERCGAEDPEDEDCGALRGGTSAAGVLAEPPNDETPGEVEDGVVAPPNEEVPGPGGVLSVDCGTKGVCVDPGGGGTSVGGVSADPPNEDVPGAGCGMPVEGETGVTAPGGGCCAAGGGPELPTEDEPAGPRRRAVAPSWVTQ